MRSLPEISFPLSDTTGFSPGNVQTVRVLEEEGHHDIIRIEYTEKASLLRAQLGQNAPVVVTLTDGVDRRTWHGYVENIRSMGEACEVIALGLTWQPRAATKKVGRVVTESDGTRWWTGAGSPDTVSVSGDAWDYFLDARTGDVYTYEPEREGSTRARGATSAHQRMAAALYACGVKSTILGPDWEAFQDTGSPWELFTRTARDLRTMLLGGRMVVSPTQELFTMYSMSCPRINDTKTRGTLLYIETASDYRELPVDVRLSGVADFRLRRGGFAHLAAFGWAWVRRIEWLWRKSVVHQEVQMESSTSLKRLPEPPEAPIIGPIPDLSGEQPVRLDQTMRRWVA